MNLIAKYPGNKCQGLPALLLNRVYNFNKSSSISRVIDVGGCYNEYSIELERYSLPGRDVLIVVIYYKSKFILSLDCQRNQLTSLDVSNITALKWLQCRSNQIVSLDVSNNTDLRSLDCGHNRLCYLDVSNNTALDNVYIKDMSSLYKVCVWGMPFPPAEIEVDATNSPNVYFTTDCN